MPTLQQVLADAAKRKDLIADCAGLIDSEVASKSGLSGIAIKGAYKVVKGVKPTFVTEAVDGLIDEFGEQLQPLATEAQESGKSVSAFFDSNKSRVAEALLAITDKRAEKQSAGVVKSTYQKLRPTAKKHVEDAVPGVGRLVQKFTAD